MTEPHVPHFDASKPATSARFKSEELRDNFSSLSRANDLRCIAQVPADLTIHVEAGSFAVTSDNTKRFVGGDSLALVISGGLPTQQRWYVLELDDTNNLIWNSNGSWAYSNPIVPSYSTGRIPLCEVLITYGDTSITQDKIYDARPMINLGIGAGNAIDPGKVYIVATAGQTIFDTSSSFTYTTGRDEILVYSDLPAIPGGLFYRISGIDYAELNDHLISFIVPFSGGERVIIWKVGTSATPGNMAFNDLSDVSVANSIDSGDRGVAIISRLSGDIPGASNPYQTLVSHNLIDHLVNVPSLLPVATHITTTATGSHKHMADEIEVVDNFAFSNASEVQGVLDDVENNIYQKYRAEHYTTGVHGPKVNINQTNADNALAIVKSNVGAGNVVSIVNSGSDSALQILNQGSGFGLYVGNTSTGYGIAVNQYNGGSAGIYVNQIGNATGCQIYKSGVGSGTALLVENAGTGIALYVNQSGNATSLRIDKSTAGIGNCIEINNSGSGNGISVRQTSTTAPSHASLFVDTYNTGLNSRSVRIDHRGIGAALYVQKITGEVGSIIEISNAGTGKDILGNGSAWSVDKSGNASFNTDTANTFIGGGFRGTWVTKTIVGNTITVSSSNYLIYLNGTGPLQTINGGTDGQIILLQVHPSVGGDIGINTSGNLLNVGDGILDWNRPDSIEFVYSAVRGKWCGIIQS